MKKVLSLLLVLVMVISMIPTSVIAVGTGTEQDPYQVGDTVTNDGSAEPEGIKAENTHWERTADVAAVQTTICQTVEHDHATAGCAAAYETVQCMLEGHPTEGETGFTHEDGTVCTYDAENALWLTNVEAGYLCGIEAHTHTVEAGCITEEPGYTVWTLAADTTSVPKGLPAMAPAPLSEVDEGRLPIHFFLASPGNITNPNGSYTNYYVPLNDNENEAWTIKNIKNDPAWSTIYSQNGIRNTSDEDIIRQYIGSWPKDSEAVFKDFGSVRIGGTTYYDTNYEIKWVSIMCRDNSLSGGMRCNQYSYKGEHIHVDGLLVEKILPGDMEVYKAIPSAVNTETTFQFTLQKMLQPNLTSVPTSADAIDTSFAPMTLTASIPAGQTSAQIVGGDEISFGYYKLTENPSTAWENNGIKLTDSRNTTQTVNTDTLYICIAPNGTVQYSTNVSGPYTTMKRVEVQNARKDVNVTYQWKVLGESGFYTELPAGAPAAPASSSQSYGSRYAYDTVYVDGTSFGDYETGLLYTFRGWDVYTHNSEFTVDTSAMGNTALDDGDANASNNQTIPMTADTYINGYWVVSKMPPADAHIAVKKIFKLDGRDVTATLENTAIAAAKGVWFRVNPGIDLDGDGLSQFDIDYPMIQADKSGEYKLPVYQYATPFTFTEHGADIPGFTRETTIEVTGENAKLVKNEDVYAEVELDPVYQDEKGHLGTITYTNSYTKNVGTPVTEYPTLTLVKRATDTGNLQEGAEFTLYSDAACTNAITSFTTNDKGIAVIDFADITPKANTYYLKETAAPEGYLVNDDVYTLTLTSATEEELRGNEFVMVTTYALSITVPADSSAEAVQSAADAQNYNLNVFNNPILGQLTVKKEATGLEDADKHLLEATVAVHGPITRDAQGNITGLGNEYALFLNEENEWTSVQPQLPIGEYLIHENMASVHGYTWDMNAVNYGALETKVYNKITSGVFEITADHKDIEVKITNIYEKWEPGDFYIYKIDPNGEHLSGATFQLYSDENCTVKVADSAVTTNAVTGANGYAWFSGYRVPTVDDDGVVTYYLKETEAPAGHYLSNTVYKVDIKAVTGAAGTTYEPKISVKNNDGQWVEAEGFSNTSDTLTVVNTPVKGQITITKDMIGAPADLTSVTFYVSGSNRYAQTVELTKEGNWTATLNDLPLGTYTIVEQKADAPGYDLVTTYEVDGTETADKATVVLSETNPGKTAMNTVFAGKAQITNTYTIRETSIENPTSLTVQKVGEDGTTPLAGAEFTLVRERDGHTVSYITNAEGKAYFSFLSGTIANGRIVEGKYTLTETKAPAGYAASDTVWEIKVKEDNDQVTIKLNQQTNIFENIWDWIIGGITDGTTDYSFENNVLTVTNEELADLTISKEFVGVTAIPDGSIIEVAVMNSEGRLVQEVELMASNNWTVKLEDLPADTYTVREVSPSLHGYTWQSAVFGVTVDGQTENGIAVGDSAVQVEVDNSEDVKVQIKNTYAVWESADFYVLKTMDDGDTPLAGAAFKLYDASGADVTDQYLHIDENIHTNDGNVTGSGGILHFQGFKVDAGKTASFMLKETAAPENYYANNNEYKITISHTSDGYDIAVTDRNNAELTIANNKAHFNYGNDVLTVVNTEILADLTIQKDFPNSDLVPNSVTVDVTGPNNYSQTVILGISNNYKVTLKDLHLGTYTVKERDASQNGYALTVKYNGEIKDSAEVTLTTANDTAAAIVNVQNTYLLDKQNPTSLIVKKVGEDGTTPLSGAEFTLRRESDGKEVSYTTDSDGKVEFSFLTGSVNNAVVETGKYILTETKAPAGYAKIDTQWKVTVKENDGKVAIKLNTTTNLFEHFWDWIIGDVTDGSNSYQLTDNTLTVKNQKLANLTVSKAFALKDSDETLTPPDGAMIEVAVFDGNGQLVKQLELNKTNGWTATVKEIPAGTYTVRENSPSVHGYTWQSAAFAVTVDGQNENGIPVGNSAVKVEVDNSEDIRVQITNTYTQWEAVDFYVLKTMDDGDTPLAGAAFNLYDASGADVTDKYLHIDENIHTNDGNVTGSGGVLHFQGFKVDAGKTASFTLQETEAPENYYANNNEYKITISHTGNEYDINITTTDGKELTNAEHNAHFNHGNDVLTVVNTEILSDLTIRKENTGFTPESVNVDVTGPNGYATTVVLDDSNDYEAKLTDLHLGTYTVKEQDASQSGYALTVKYDGEVKDSAEVILTEENDTEAEAAVVTIENIYKQDQHNQASFTVKKVDAVTKEPLKGAKFGLYDASGALFGAEQTTDTDGKVTFGPFAAAAEYTLKEIAAPDYYHKTDATWTVTVKDVDGQPRVVVDENKLNTNIWDWIVDIITGQTNAEWNRRENTLTVPNTKKTGVITISKEVTDPQALYADEVYSFTLDCSDDAFDETFTLKANERKTFENIPWGTTYKLTEDITGAAFTGAITDEGAGMVDEDQIQITVTNTYAYTTHNAGLNLVKVDAEDNTKTIKGAGFTLYADEKCETVMVEEVLSDADGKVNIPVAEAGTYYLKETTTPAGYHPNETVYVVKAEEKAVVKNAGAEEAVTEMQMHITITGMTGTTDNQIDYIYAVENTAIKHFDVSVQKKWDDGGYHARPASVEAVLLRDGKVFDTKELNAANGWKYIWKDLTDEYTWSVDEKATPAEYVKSVTNEKHDWTITNTRTPNAVEITVTKAWNHNGGKNLPESIQVTLYADGKAKETVTLNEKNQWTYTWKNLTDVSVWSVDEVEVPTGYTKTVKVDGYKFEITNTRTINPVEVSVTKVWVASEGVILPESIEAVLLRDGKEFKTVTLSADNEWTYKWTDLTDEYTWSVDEKTVPEGYTKNVTNTGNDFTITNTRVFKNVDVSVEKIWYSPNVNHPASVEVTLYRDGVAFDTVKLDASNGWKYVWKNLTNEFVWTVDEPSVPSGYTKEVKDLGGNVFQIVNTHEDIPRTGDFTNFGGLAMMGITGVFGFLATAFFLLAPRKKGKYER